jgi:transketolase N-terminal domain/subunit
LNSLLKKEKMEKIKLYIVEDDIIIANDLKHRIIGLGYEVLGIDGKGENAIESIDALAANDN